MHGIQWIPSTQVDTEQVTPVSTNAPDYEYEDELPTYLKWVPPALPCPGTSAACEPRLVPAGAAGGSQGSGRITRWESDHSVATGHHRTPDQLNMRLVIVTSKVMVNLKNIYFCI